jgi:hypothetical protein
VKLIILYVHRYAVDTIRYKQITFAVDVIMFKYTPQIVAGGLF